MPQNNARQAERTFVYKLFTVTGTFLVYKSFTVTGTFLAYETGISISDSKEIVDAVFRILTSTLLKGEEVRIANFATFKEVDRAPRTIQSSTGETMKGITGKRVKVRMSETVRRVLDPAFREGKKS